MPTQTAYRRGLAPEIGTHGTFLATGGSLNQIQCPAVFDSSEWPATALAYTWVYVPAVSYPQQRLVTKDGLDFTTGTITVDGNFGSPILSEMQFELLGRLPAIRTAVDGYSLATVPGLLDCINRALRHLLISDDHLTIHLVSHQEDYSLAAWPWLERPNRLLEVRQRSSDGTRWISAADQGHRWELREDVDGPVLHLAAPYRFSDGAYDLRLRALRPANTKIKPASTGVWTDWTGPGLVFETDEAQPDVNAVTAVAKAFAYAALRDTRPEPDRARYDRLYRRQVRVARKAKGYDPDNDIDPGVPAETEREAAAALALEGAA